MFLLLILIVTIITIYVAYTQSSTKGNTSDNKKSSTENYQIEGHKKFDLVGLYYHNIGDNDLGFFKGYAIAEGNNLYDEYAVAIYRNDGKHLGYTPANYATLHSSIIDDGNKVPIWGSIEKSDGGY